MDLFKPHSIALVGPLPPPFGGMANQTLQLSKLLEGEGVKVKVVRTNSPYQPKWISEIKGIRALFRLIPYLVNVWITLRKVQLVHLMANSGWSWHLYAAPVIWMAHLKKVPVVVNYRGGEADVFFTKSIAWVRPSLRRVAKVVVPSGFLEHVFSHFNIPSSVVPNIIDLERFLGDEKRTLNKASPHFIVCRNLEAIYDVGTALKAFSSIVAAYPQARLTIAGEGPERDALEQQVADLGIQAQVVFTGRLDPEKMASLYMAADIMLNTSRVDNMPNALLEAMSAGVPIVSTDAGGIPYMVEHEQTALLRPIGDWEGIADAALMLLTQDNVYQRLSDNGVKDVFRYRWESVKPLWLTLYAEVLSDRYKQ